MKKELKNNIIKLVKDGTIEDVEVAVHILINSFSKQYLNQILCDYALVKEGYFAEFSRGEVGAIFNTLNQQLTQVKNAAHGKYTGTEEMLKKLGKFLDNLDTFTHLYEEKLKEIIKERICRA